MKTLEKCLLKHDTPGDGISAAKPGGILGKEEMP